MVLSAARDRSSTESKFLPGLTRELLDDIGDDELRCGKKGNNNYCTISVLCCIVLCRDHARDVRVIASLNRTR